MAQRVRSFSQGDWAIVVAGCCVASMVLCWFFLGQTTGDSFYSLVDTTTGVAIFDLFVLIIYLFVYVINLFDKDRDRRHAFIGLASIIMAILIVAFMGLSIQIARL